MLKITNISNRKISIGSYSLEPSEILTLQDTEINNTIFNKIKSLSNINFIKTIRMEDKPNDLSDHIEQSVEETIQEVAEIEKPKNKSNKKK